LKEAGQNVDSALEDKENLFLATSEKYDALLVVRMLPIVDSITIIKTICGGGHSDIYF